MRWGPVSKAFPKSTSHRRLALLAGVQVRVAELKPSTWISLVRAAQFLGESPESLRKKLTRAARKGDDGVVEAEFDGIRARKLGRNWKVRLSGGWLR